MSKRIGEVGVNKKGKEMTIIEYVDYSNIIVKFDNGHYVHTQYGNFKRGGVNDEDYEVRIGEVNNNTFGSKMIIVKYITNKNIIVEFDN